MGPDCGLTLAQYEAFSVPRVLLKFRCTPHWFLMCGRSRFHACSMAAVAPEHMSMLTRSLPEISC